MRNFIWTFCLLFLRIIYIELHSYTRAVESDFCRLYAMLLIAVEITGIIIIIEREIVENLSFIGYDKGIN